MKLSNKPRPLFLLLLIALPVQADMSVRAYQHSRLADDDTYMTGRWTGVQLSYGTDDYVFLSQERVAIIPLWGIGDLTLTGVGVGTTHRIGRFSFFAQAGYFFVDHENEGRHPMSHDGGEGISYYMNNRFSFIDGKSYRFDEFQIDYQDTFAIEIGGMYKYPLSQSWSADVSLSYRYMRLEEFFRVYKDEWNFEETGACWEQGVTRDFSTINIGLSLNYEF